MKKAPSLVLAFLLGGGATAVTQSTKDAVEVDPTHHHVILENPKVRVFEVMAERGDKSPMHSHRPLVAVSLGKGRLRMGTPDGKSSIFAITPDKSSGGERGALWSSCGGGAPGGRGTKGAR